MRFLAGLTLLLTTVTALPSNTTAKSDLIPGNLLDFVRAYFPIAFKPRRPGCHSGMNWWQFTAPIGDTTTSKHAVISVGSPWNIRHNKELWKLLENRVHLQRANEIENELSGRACLWKPTQHGSRAVKKWGVTLANIDVWAPHRYQYKEEVADLPIFETLEISKDLDSRIREAVMLTYPWREILVLVMMTVVFPLLVLLPLVACCLAGRRKVKGKHLH